WHSRRDGRIVGRWGIAPGFRRSAPSTIGQMNDILFADDDPAMRAMVSEVLIAAGYRVRLAMDGDGALAELRSAEPAIVVLDYRMGAPDGLEVCRRIKSDPRLEHLPVLIPP